MTEVRARDMLKVSWAMYQSGATCRQGGGGGGLGGV